MQFVPLASQNMSISGVEINWTTLHSISVARDSCDPELSHCEITQNFLLNDRTGSGNGAYEFRFFCQSFNDGDPCADFGIKIGGENVCYENQGPCLIKQIELIINHSFALNSSQLTFLVCTHLPHRNTHISFELGPRWLAATLPREVIFSLAFGTLTASRQSAFFGSRMMADCLWRRRIPMMGSRSFTTPSSACSTIPGKAPLTFAFPAVA